MAIEVAPDNGVTYPLVLDVDSSLLLFDPSSTSGMDVESDFCRYVAEQFMAWDPSLPEQYILAIVAVQLIAHRRYFRRQGTELHKYAQTLVFILTDSWQHAEQAWGGLPKEAAIGFLIGYSDAFFRSASV